jgi:hypothetical protein
MGWISATGGFVTGFVTGFSTGYLAHDRMPEIRSIASPTIKLLLRSGIRATERSREGLAQLGEIFQDLFAEVQHEFRFKSRQNAKRPSVGGSRRAVRTAPAEEIAKSGEAKVIRLNRTSRKRAAT